MILKGCVVGPNMWWLISFFQDHAEIVCKSGGYYRTAFWLERGETQGGPMTPRLFNIMVDDIMIEWIWDLLGNKAV